jgi:cytochrome c553
MWRLRDLDWRRGLFWLAAFAAVVVVGLALFVASGVYNVAASVPHFQITDRFIKFALRRSIATHSTGIDVPDLSDEGLVRLGAVHFRVGCAPCHGSGADDQNPVVTKMLPSPPPLRNAARDWETEELFWIVRHGLKFTGMPAWAGRDRDDEVWALVAYLEHLPELEEEEPAVLTGGSGQTGSQRSPALQIGATSASGFELCASCHGDAERRPVSPLVPALQGQSAAYLHRAMQEYREGLRESGMMEPIAAAPNREQVERIADRYADMPRLSSPPSTDTAAVERGREIAETGSAAGGIPPCLSCHSDAASARFPRLAGLSQTYIANQLDLFRKGVREQTAYGAIMATIARRLSQEQIDDVAAYFAQARDAAPPTFAGRGQEPAR